MGLLFDGATMRVDCTSATVLDDIFVGGGTVMARIYAVGYGEGTFGRIMDKASSTGLALGWSFYITSDGNELRLGHGHVASTTSQTLWATPNDSILLETPYHVAATLDKDSGTNNALLYIEGVSQTINEVLTGTGDFDSDAAEVLSIGNRSSAVDRSFNGVIADARLYNRALSAAEIQTISACHGHDGIVSGLVGRWFMAELGFGDAATDANSIKDYSGNGNHGTPVGSPTYAGSFISTRRRIL